MLKSGMVLGPVGQTAGTTQTKGKLRSGTVLGPVNEESLKEKTPLVLPGMPVSKQMHLTDAQKQEAAVSRGFNSAMDETVYQKNNPNLYAVTGGQKYMGEGYAALKNPQKVITPQNLTDEGKQAVKSAQEADAGKSIYDGYTPEQIDKTISAKWHRSTNDAETKKTVDFLKALKGIKEIGFNSFQEYNQVRKNPEIISEYKANMDKAYKDYQNAKVGIVSKAVDRYVGGSKNTESVEETQAREAWEKAAAKYYTLIYGGKQALEQRYELLKQAAMPMSPVWQKNSALKALGIKPETALREEREVAAALERTRNFDNYGDYIGENVKAGAVNLLTGLSATGEFIFYTPIKFSIELAGGDSSVFSGKAARDALTNEFNKRANEAATAIGDERNIGGQIIQNIIQNIPNMVLAFVTAGGSEAATLSEKAASLSGKAGTLQKIGAALKSLANNPLYWMSFATTAGNDYEEALSNGANPNVAMLYALAASGLNAYIEIGGGIETLPKDLVGLKGGGSLLKEFITTSLEEGGEEILQGAVSKLFSRIMYDRSSFSLEKTVDFAKQSLYEGAMGVLGGAVMGGGQMTFSVIKNAKTASAYKAMGEVTIKTGQADSIIKYSLGSDLYSELAQTAAKTGDTKAIGELYSYVCRDIDAAINGADSIEAAVIGLKSIAEQEGLRNDTYAVTRGVAVPQFIEKVTEFEFDEKTAEAIADAVLITDIKTNIETNAKIEAANPQANTKADNTIQNAGEAAENSLGGDNAESEAYYGDEAEKNTAIIGEQYSIGKNNIIDISDDSELASRVGAVDGSKRQRIIGKYIFDLLGGQKIVLSDGRVATVDKGDAHHIGFMANSKKVAAISQITELLKKAQLVAEEESTKDKKFDYFYYYEAKVKYRNDIISLYLNVGNTRNKSGYRLYDITEKLRDTAHQLNGVSRLSKSIGLETVSPNSIIPTSDEKINNDLENGEMFDEVTEYDDEGENIFTEPEKREIFENKISGKDLTIIQQHIEETAKRLDPDIQIRWDKNLNKNGSFNPYTKVLTLRADLTVAEAYVEVFKHEFMHYLELKSGYDKFLKYLENKSVAFTEFAKSVLKEAGIEYRGGNAGAVKALFDYYYEKYITDTRLMPVQRRAFTIDNAKREAAADFVGEVLFKGKEYRGEIADALKYGNKLPDGDYETSLSALNELAQKDKGLFNRIIEAVKRFISNLRGHKTNNKLVADLEKLERKLKKVYESAETKRPTEDIGEKFSIKFDKKGKYVEIDTDQHIFDDSKGKSASSIINDYMKKKFRGKVYKTGDTTAYVGSRGVNEYAHPANHNVRPEIYDAKLRAGTELDNLLYVSEFLEHKTDDGRHKEAVFGWDYYRTVFSVDGRFYEGIIKIMCRQNGREFIDVTKINEIPHNAGLSSDKNTLQEPADVGISNDSIRQSAQNSQENFSDKEQFSLGNSRLNELRYNPEMFAKRLINKYHLKADPKEVARKIQKIITEHNKGGRELTTNSDGEWSRTLIADGLADELAKEIAGTVKLNITDEAQEILKAIRGVKVCVNHRQLEEIKYKYGNLTEYRKQTGLGVTAASNTRLDSQWQEWAELYPQYFDSGTNSVDMPGEYARIVDRLKNSREEVDNSELAEAIAGDIKETLESTGPKAHEREKNQAVKEAVKKARAEEREKAAKDFDDYRKRESERKYNEAVSKRKREYRDKALKLRDKFTKMLEKPKKGSYVPLPFIRAVVDALDIIYDNPIDYDDSKIGGKYAAKLNALNQEIQRATNETVREALKEQHDRLFRTATNAADRVLKVKEMLDALKSEDAYEKVYNDAGDNKLFGERAQMYDESISKMLEVLSRELGDTEAYNYNEHQLRIISEVFTALDKHIHDYNTLIGRQERVEVSEAAEKFIDEVMRSHGDFKVLNKAVLAQMSPMRLFRMLGNYETGSQAETIADELDKGQRKSIEYTMKAEQMIRDEILGNNELFKETRKMFSTKESDLVDSGLVDKNGNKVMITRGMRLSLVMHGRNEQNRNAVMGGVEIPKDLENYYKNGAVKSKSDTLKAVVPTDALQWFTRLNSSLSDIEKKWIRVLDKYYSEISAPALNEITMQLYGFKKATVKNYWRIVRTEHFLDKPVDTVVRDALLEHAGYLEKRKNAKNPIFLIDAIDQLQNDIENHANYYGLVIPLSNFSKVYNYAQYDFENEKWGTSIKEMIDNKYSGGAVTGYIENLIADLNGARKREVSIFDRIRDRYAQAVLSLNPRVAVKQTASYPTAAAVIGWKPLIKALAVVEQKNGDKKFVFARAELDEIAKYSPLLWYRMRGNMDAELGDLKEAGSPGDKLAKKMPVLLGWINKMDAGTVGRLWYASKYYVEDNFKYEKGSPQFYKKTAEIFEKVIEETQPNYTVMQRPDILRSTNALTRAVTMFYTQRLQNANILFDSTMEWRAKSKAYKNASESGKVVAEAELKEARAKFGRAVSSQAVSLVVLNVMEFVVRAALSQMKPYRDKDTDEVSESAIYRGLGDTCLETLFGTVVFGSEIYDAIKLGVGAAKGQYYGIQVPAVETINDTVNLFINDSNWIKDTAVAIKDGKMTMNDFAEQLTARTLDNIIKVVQPFTGIPVKNAKDMISGIVHSAMDMFNGDLFKYEAEVADNAYNRIVGTKTRTNTQYYRTLAEAVINDDREKYESTLKRFINDTKPDKTTLTGIKSALKDTEAVKSETEKALGEVSKNKTYKGLSDKGKKDVETNVAGVIVNEKLLSVGKQRSKKFGQLYEYKRKKNKTAYERLKKELSDEGLSESDIEIGEEIAKFKFLSEQGISVSEWFTAKKALSEENARKNAEKYKAIQKMDFSAKDKKALWENLK